MGLQGTGRETPGPTVPTPSWAAGHSLWQPGSASVSILGLCVSVPAILTAPLSPSPSPSACLSFLAPIPPHPIV